MMSENLCVRSDLDVSYYFYLAGIRPSFYAAGGT